MPTKKNVEVFTIIMRDDGILHMHTEAEVIVDMRLYKILIEAIGEVSGGKKVPILSTAGELTIPDEEVRKYMSDPKANPYSLANALIGPSISQKLIGNFFVKLMEGERPVRLFNREEDAITWLKTFL